MKNINLSRGFCLTMLLTVTSYAGAHSAPLGNEALQACFDKQKSQYCEYKGHHNDLYIGTCQYIDEQQLVCVRNKAKQKEEKVTVKVTPNVSNNDKPIN